VVRIILFVVGLAVLVAGAVWLANDPGSATVVWHGWRLDTSAALLFVIVALVVIALAFIARLLALVQNGFRAFTAQRNERRLRRGLTVLGDGFAAVHAGHGPTARRLAQEAAKLLDDNPAVAMLRKHAAAMGGDTDELKAAT